MSRHPVGEKLHARQWLANNIHVFTKSAQGENSVKFEVVWPAIDHVTAEAAQGRVLRELQKAFPDARFTSAHNNPIVSCEETGKEVYVQVNLPTRMLDALNALRGQQQGLGA